MYDVSCTLISTSIQSDEIGVQKETKTETVIPIIKVEDIYAKEFYSANEQGYKPSLRLRINSLNYNGENELKYMNKTYCIIRTQEVTLDELVLICELKIKNL